MAGWGLCRFFVGVVVLVGVGCVMFVGFIFNKGVDVSFSGRVRSFVNPVDNPRGWGIRFVSVVVVAAVSFGGVSAADAHDSTTETYEEKVPVWEWVDEPVMATRQVPVYSLVPTLVEVERTREVPVYSYVPTKVRVERTREVPVYSLVPTKVRVERTREVPTYKKVYRWVRVAPFRQRVTIQPPCEWATMRGHRFWYCPPPRTSWQNVYNYNTVTRYVRVGTRTETYTITETQMVRKKTGTRTETYTITETQMVRKKTGTRTETYTETVTQMVYKKTGTRTETYDTGVTRLVWRQTGTRTVTRTRRVHVGCPVGYHELNSPNTSAWFRDGVVVFVEPNSNDGSTVQEVVWKGPVDEAHPRCYQATAKPKTSILDEILDVLTTPQTVFVAGVQYVVSGGRTVIDGVTHIVEKGKVLTTKIVVAGVEHAISGGRAVINGVTYAVEGGKVVAKSIIVAGRSFAIAAGRTVIDGVTHIVEGGRVLTTKIVVAGVEHAISGARAVIDGVTYVVEAGKVVAKSIVVAGRSFVITAGRVIIDGSRYAVRGGKIVVGSLYSLSKTLKDAVVAEIKTGLERLEENAVAAICENRLTSSVVTGATGLVLKPILVAALIKVGIAIPPVGVTVAFFVGGVALFVLACSLAEPWYTPDAPPRPTGLRLLPANRSIQVSWNPSPSRHTFRFGYDLRWKRSTQSWDDATIKKLGDSVTSYRITGLTNGTVYNVRLEAHNLGGDSADVTATATPRGASPRSTPTPTTTTTTTTVPSRSATPSVVTCSGRLTIQDMVKANRDVASGVITRETWRANQRCWDKQRGH